MADQDTPDWGDVPTRCMFCGYMEGVTSQADVDAHLVSQSHLDAVKLAYDIEQSIYAPRREV